MPAMLSSTFSAVVLSLFAVALNLGATVPASASPTMPPVTSSAANERGVDDSITRLYLAVFDRDPDAAGHAHWVHVYRNGLSLDRIAAAFMDSPEWRGRYGTLPDDRFVELLYCNVLRRAPDDAGYRYWVNILGGANRAPLARDRLLVEFSESEEFVQRTGTARPVAPDLPFPSLPEGSGHGRRIVYANQAQRVWLVESDGTVHDSYLVSGRRDTPLPGTYSVYSKSPKAWAGHDGITMNHMVRFTRGRRLAIGFHSIPTYSGGRPMQTLAQLGTYRSAGCVRQEGHQAEALYHWADIGTTVVVLD